MSMIKSATAYLVVVLLALPLTSCALKSSQREGNESINTSALYAPPVVTFLKGKTYQLREGQLTPNSDQVFYSKYQYLRALTIGAE